MDNALPDVEGGWRWRPAAIPDVDPDAPLQELQRRMRLAEAELAEELAAGQVLTVLDGTLARVRAPDVAIVGYVKTHHRALLAPDHHARVPSLRAGERTTLFQLHRQGLRGRPYSCYFRLAEAATMASPWSGIVRLEVPESGGLERARRLIDIWPRQAHSIRRCAASRPSGAAEPAADRCARDSPAPSARLARTGHARGARCGRAAAPGPSACDARGDP